MPSFHASVGEIVETVLRSGSIDTRYSPRSRLQEGTEIHRALQGMYGKDDQSEVAVKTVYPGSWADLEVSGRIDGILSASSGSPVIEEIKSTMIPAQEILSPFTSHLAQAKAYAYIISLQRSSSQMAVRVRYRSIPSRKDVSFDYTFPFSELEEFFAQICDAYLDGLLARSTLAEKRDDTLSTLAFPFEYREHQREAAARIYKTVTGGERLFICAPTGSGKTINAVFPALKSLQGSLETKIFYLTGKSTQKQVALSCLSLLVSRGLFVTATEITAKEKCCPDPSLSCNPDECERARDYYTRSPILVRRLTETCRILTASVIADFASEHGLCPFELSLDAAVLCDVVVCDYNYVFDPFSSLKRFFDTPDKNHVLLVDEAHSLADRARDMHSASLVRRSFADLEPVTKGTKMHARVTGMVKALALCAKEREESGLEMNRDIPEALGRELDKFMQAADTFLVTHPEHRASKELTALYFDALRFQRLYAERTDAHYVYWEDGQERLLCCEAREFLADRLSSVKSAVFFSATLFPLPYYAKTLGGSGGDLIMRQPACFDPSNLRVIAETGIRTTYRAREAYYPEIAGRITEFRKAFPGNCICYFPSYAFLENVLALMPSPDEILVQRRSMSEPERAGFLEEFESQGNLLSFCVAGGVFAEAVDLAGGRLSSAVICGVFLPMVGTDREMMRAHFDKAGLDGFTQAYLLPSASRVLQAAGRVIRTADDTGTVLFLDERFGQEPYRGWLEEFYPQTMFVHGVKEFMQEIGSRQDG